MILDRLVIGYIFPFAKSWVVRDDSVNSEKEPLRLLVSESPFVYRRGNTTRLGSRRERCGYLEGLIEGVLQHSEAGSGIEIEETACIARGAKSCVFECRRRVELLQ